MTDEESKAAFYAKIRAAEDRLLATWIDGYKPTAGGLEALARMARRLEEATKPHLDNTGGDCRIDFDGHDCCGTCNLAEDALKLLVHYEAR